jgi:hypothetical protein
VKEGQFLCQDAAPTGVRDWLIGRFSLILLQDKVRNDPHAPISRAKSVEPRWVVNSYTSTAVTTSLYPEDALLASSNPAAR